jgi:hypothetical protein
VVVAQRAATKVAGQFFQPAWATGIGLSRVATISADRDRGIHSIYEDDEDEELARLTATSRALIDYQSALR